jgi:rhodanese-related sulfurtransferase
MITAAELKSMMERGESVLPLDVRQPAAFAQQPGGIPSSLRIPPASVPDQYARIPRDRLVVSYCT